MSKPFIFRRPDESEEDAERRLAQETAEAEQASQAESEDADADDEIRPELRARRKISFQSVAVAETAVQWAWGLMR